jgi:hypothetical protein
MAIWLKFARPLPPFRRAHRARGIKNAVTREKGTAFFCVCAVHFGRRLAVEGEVNTLYRCFCGASCIKSALGRVII